MANKKKEILVWPGARLDFSQGCIVMGILNVTPDSFSDGGNFLDTETAVARGLEIAHQGAAIIDIGGESTRPGAAEVTGKEQIQRVLPIIQKLASKVNIPISIDSKNYDVTKAAVEAGASIINDITALADERTARLAAEKELPVVLMHTRGEPATMQKQSHYQDVVQDVLDYLLERAKRAQALGIAKDKIFIDPGIGFAKNLEHNLSILKNLAIFVQSGYRVLLGTSRKKFIGTLTGREIPKDRIFGTAATVAIAAAAGVSVVRIHDVAEMVDVVKVANKMSRLITF